MDPHLSVDAGALDAGEDPQVGGKPLRVYKHKKNKRAQVSQLPPVYS